MPHPHPIRNATIGGSPRFLAASPAMMPEKARIPPIERSNMPLIMSTIMPHARIGLRGVKQYDGRIRRTREGSRFEDGHQRDQADNENNEQQLPLRCDADE